MILKIFGEEWKISFSYQNFPRNLTDAYPKKVPDGATYRMTTCLIQRKNTFTGEQLPDQTGESFCSPLDTFAKSTGRKMSFGRALKALYPDRKVERTEVWNAYWKQRCRDNGFDEWDFSYLQDTGGSIPRLP